MHDWSPFQLAVFADVAHGTGHTVVDAVAGSGKTSTIEAAVEHVPPRLSTMFVAFNKSIADEKSGGCGDPDPARAGPTRGAIVSRIYDVRTVVPQCALVVGRVLIELLGAHAVEVA